MSLEAAFLRQAGACADLGSPFMERLMTLAAENLRPEGKVGARLFSWPGNLSSDGQSVPLRFAGALHALKLQGDPDLTPAYPPNEASDAELWRAVEQVLETRAGEVLAWLDSPPQTNEVRRSVALIAAAHWLTARYAMPIKLSELGASAGLNLMFDRFALKTQGAVLGPDCPALTLSPRWEGAAPPQASALDITERRGVDLNPIDPQTEAGQLRLRAYLWPDQAERRALTDAAISVAEAVVDRGDAIDWLADRLTPVPGQLHLVYHTIAWQYFPADVQARGEALLAATRASQAAPLARLAMEADGAGPGAGLWVQLWPSGEKLALGRIDFHGRWINWQAG